MGTMLLFYTLEKRSTWFILAFAGSCVLSSVYGFLQGAWPFGVIEGIWSLVAVRRWRLERTHWKAQVVRENGNAHDCEQSAARRAPMGWRCTGVASDGRDPLGYSDEGVAKR